MYSEEFLKRINADLPVESIKLIMEFFITFSRFECSLKESITFANGGPSKVEANWDKFVSSISQIFNSKSSEALNNSVSYILENPPRIQALDSNQLIWRDRVFDPNTPDLNKLSLHIKDIRNNLFHGGKFNGRYEADISRNYILIKSSLIILNSWLSLDKSIQKDFLSPFV